VCPVVAAAGGPPLVATRGKRLAWDAGCCVAGSRTTFSLPRSASLVGVNLRSAPRRPETLDQSTIWRAGRGTLRRPPPGHTPTRAAPRPPKKGHLFFSSKTSPWRCAKGGLAADPCAVKGPSSFPLLGGGARPITEHQGQADSRTGYIPPSLPGWLFLFLNIG